MTESLRAGLLGVEIPRRVSLVQSMYEDANTVVRVKCRDSKAFGVMVSVHQVSELSPILFAILLETLSKQFRKGLPIELLNTDELVLMAETEELLVEKIQNYKRSMEGKRLIVNLNLKVNLNYIYIYLGKSTHISTQTMHKYTVSAILMARTSCKDVYVTTSMTCNPTNYS